MAEKKKWMQDLDIEKGALRKKLGAKPGKDIPEAKLEKAAHSKSPKLKKEAVLAMNFKKANHRAGKR